MKDPTAARHSPPPGSEEELRGLLASLPEKAAVRGMLFNAVLEVMRQSDGETAVQQCLAVTGEKTFLDYFSYPPGKYLELLYAAARLHSGGLEGFVIGAAAGAGYAIATRGGGPERPGRLGAAGIMALSCGLAGLAITLTGRPLVGGTIHAIADAAHGSRATLAPLGRLIGDTIGLDEVPLALESIRRRQAGRRVVRFEPA